MKRSSSTQPKPAIATAKKKKATMRQVVVIPNDSGGFSIDRDDSQVLEKLLLRVWVHGKIEKTIWDAVGFRENDAERRVYSLNLYGEVDWDLFFTLPEEIGNLTGLNILDLTETGITTLPSSIGKLHNLKELNLQNTRFLTQLPEDVGNLSSLENLCLRGSFKSMLPSTIGKLQNLKVLDLYGTRLSKLPEDVFNLLCLECLSLGGTSIVLLPSSIRKLKNLRGLDLSFTRSLSELPTEIGDLTSLKILSLISSNVSSLPHLIRGLKSLVYLFLQNSKILELEGNRNQQTEFLFDLVQQCQSLAHIGYCDAKVRYVLGCRRVQSRMRVWNNGNSSIEMTTKLWPYLLNYPTRLFSKFPDPFVDNTLRMLSHDTSVERPDAIYQLLMDGREPFIRHLIPRN